MQIQGGPQNGTHFFLYALTLQNINRFSKLFHCQNQDKICNNTITKDPTTPKLCRYTIPTVARTTWCINALWCIVAWCMVHHILTS